MAVTEIMLIFVPLNHKRGADAAGLDNQLFLYPSTLSIDYCAAVPFVVGGRLLVLVLVFLIGYHSCEDFLFKKLDIIVLPSVPHPSV